MHLTYWREGLHSCDEEWERAYASFETPEEEIRKFTQRFYKLGLLSWPRSLKIVELFCGRGNGLKALELLGFNFLEGVDLSPSLLGQYRGQARLYVGDCRQLKLEDESRDVVIVQGGLHHLSTLPNDLEDVLAEGCRILKAHGHIVIVEPWPTLFLRVAHTACAFGLLRRLWTKLDALAYMIERERGTYLQWLREPHTILGLLEQYFSCERQHITRGKLMYIGRKR